MFHWVFKYLLKGCLQILSPLTGFLPPSSSPVKSRYIILEYSKWLNGNQKTVWERRKQLGMSGFGMVWRTPGRIPVSALDGKTHRTGIQTGVEPPVQTLVVHNHPITGVSVQYWGPTGGGTPGQTHCFAGLLLTWFSPPVPIP